MFGMLGPRGPIPPSVLTIHGPHYWVEVTQTWIDITSEGPTPDEWWTFTDKAGHTHAYDRGYPTLKLVVDKSHWCDGREGLYNHDEHRVVDESHYVCRDCAETIDPAEHPGGYYRQIPDRRTAKMRGYRATGTKIEFWLTDEEFDQIAAMTQPERDAYCLGLVDTIPDDRITNWEFHR